MYQMFHIAGAEAVELGQLSLYVIALYHKIGHKQ